MFAESLIRSSGLTETFGTVTLEAMASGLPLVAYDYAAAGQYVRHDKNGLLAGYGRTDDFTAMAGELAARHSDNPEVFRTIGRNARLTAESLDWKHVVRQLEALMLAIT